MQQVNNFDSIFTEIYDSDTSYIPILPEGILSQTIIDLWTKIKDSPPYEIKALLYHTEIVSNDDPPGIFDGMNLKVYGTEKEAEEKLSINLKAFIETKLSENPKAKRRIICWRVRPEIAENRDYKTDEKVGYSGYARLAIYQE
ncbi:MAG: hypothetical protein ABIE47_08150 [Pseudomonadota bacterium]